MYEYVITAGPGIMLEHGVSSLQWINDWASPAYDRQVIVMYSLASDATDYERFH